MATHTKRNRKDDYRIRKPFFSREALMRYFPAWALLAVVGLMIAPRVLLFAVKGTLLIVGAAPGIMLDAAEGAIHLAGDVVVGVVNTAGDAINGVAGSVGGRAKSDAIAPLFTDEVEYWSGNIEDWASEYTLDPNLLATVMQIESCGHPTVSSSAGAQGLFQVMPFHFATGEDQLDPDTNAMRGANFLNYCLDASSSDAGLAMACYNGGPSVLSKDYAQWPAQTQRYYMWGTGIYADAVAESDTSPTLDRWLAAGGATLCEWASAEIGG
ncbi:MAG: transglycosylase SLT domain-containing protein [Chitinophagaceae bacterium]|nr:transglycosylase SLT domain-containing protein [Anaerolineae bacterium]